jgi:hypothetical protein
MLRDKKVLTAFVAGILVAAFAYHAYVVYQNRQAIGEIYNWINAVSAPAEQGQQPPADQGETEFGM